MSDSLPPILPPPPPAEDPRIISYKSAETPLPVTRGERLVVVSGYAMTCAGFLAVLYWADLRPVSRNPMLIAGALLFLAGAALTIFCFLYNAIRRM